MYTEVKKLRLESEVINMARRKVKDHEVILQELKKKMNSLLDDKKYDEMIKKDVERIVDEIHSEHKWQ
jgi:Arc/MetJ-type ribon-helix-helix transcriptional regulator